MRLFGWGITLANNLNEHKLIPIRTNKLDGVKWVQDTCITVSFTKQCFEDKCSNKFLKIKVYQKTIISDYTNCHSFFFFRALWWCKGHTFLSSHYASLRKLWPLHLHKGLFNLEMRL